MSSGSAGNKDVCLLLLRRAIDVGGIKSLAGPPSGPVLRACRLLLTLKLGLLYLYDWLRCNPYPVTS